MTLLNSTVDHTDSWSVIAGGVDGHSCLDVSELPGMGLGKLDVIRFCYLEDKRVVENQVLETSAGEPDAQLEVIGRNIGVRCRVASDCALVEVDELLDGLKPLVL